MEVIDNDPVDRMSSVFDDEMDVRDVFASPGAKDLGRPGTPSSQPSIDFSAATPDSKAGLDMPLPFDEPLEAHDAFDFDGGLDIFSDGEDNKSISDISDDETRKKPKQKKAKPTKERKLKPRKEEPEIRKVSVVETEIEVVKKLQTGPSVAELRRRQLIEIDQDEFEERVEKLNKVTLQVMAKSLGLTKEEQLQKIIECREFLKPHWDDGEMGDFIEDTFDKINSRLYGTTTVPANGADAMDYLDRASYSDDDWIDEPEDDRKAPDAPEAPVEESKQQQPMTEVTPAKAGLIELSDSDGSDEEDGDNEGDAGRAATASAKAAATVTAPVTATALPTAPSAPAVVTPQDAARLRLAKLERQRTAAAEREAIELEQRRQRYLAACKAPKNARQALLISLRQKVQQTAKENYCNQRKISSEQLALRLKIAEKCRQLAELLKERQETRDQHKREARRAKFQEMADADEVEFDEDGEGALAEGQYLTAEEKAAILRGFEESEEESEAEQESDADEMDGDEALPGIRPVDEELQGVRGLRAKVEGDSQSDGEQEEMETGGDDDVEETQQQVTGVDEDEDEEVVKVVRSSRSRPVGSANVNDDADVTGEGHGDNDTDSRTGAAKPASMSVLRKYGSARVAKATAATEEGEGEGEAMDLDADSVAASAAAQPEEQADAGSVDNRTLATAQTQKKDKERRKKQSTGNALYRLALEEEERRSRRQKSNMFLEDEAAEEEEEGLQAGLGDFGFGVTSNIREHDEEMAALKVRKGDFDHIVDDVSEDEGDEAAGAVARAEMELQEDRARDRAIITAVTEGHDALRKMQKKGKYTFNKLVGEGVNARRGDAENGNQDQPATAPEDEWDEEEMLQRGMKERFEREYQTRARRGRNADSDSDSAEGSDNEDNLLEQLDTSGMTEEEKAQEIERLRRLQERNRMDALMAKQRTLSYKMARARVQQEKLQRKLLLKQQSQQENQSGALSAAGSSGVPSLLRQGSMGFRPAVTRSLTLEPLQDEYSRLLANTMSMASATATATATSASAPGGSSLLMAPPSTGSASGVSPRNSAGVASSAATAEGEDSKLKDQITNHPEQQVKRRTMQAPKHASTATAGLRRGHTVHGGSRPTKTLSANVDGGLYKSELNALEVESGYGMGMALPSSTRHPTAQHKNGKTDLSGGLFSAVTGGLRRFGDLGKATTAGASNGTGAAAGGNALKKRTFSEVGKLSSTVAAQQFVFASSTTASYSMLDESSQQFSRLGGESSLGFGASRTASLSNAAGASRPRAGGEGPATGGSLFAQLGAKRGGGLKSASARQ